jgi:hypothetical protein
MVAAAAGEEEKGEARWEARQGGEDETEEAAMRTTTIQLTAALAAMVAVAAAQMPWEDSQKQVVVREPSTMPSLTTSMTVCLTPKTPRVRMRDGGCTFTLLCSISNGVVHKLY